VTGEAAAPSKVLMTADPIGGVWQYAVELSRGLSKVGTAVGLATMGAPLSSGQREEIGAIPGVELFESSFRLEWMNDPWGDVARAGDWLLAIERSFKPDIIHLNGYVHAALPWHTPLLVVGHSCVLSWWRAVKGEQVPSTWLRYEAAVRRGLHAASLVACPSLAMLSALQKYYGVASGRVVPNGRSGVPPVRGRKSEFILSSGRLWDEAKNLAALDSAAAHLAWPVMVAGSEVHPDGREVRSKNLYQLGELRTGDLNAHMSRAAIYAAPARYEPFGLSILEAALCGCTLVLGDIPSLREVWGDAAIYVPPNDSGTLAAELNALIDSPNKREIYGAKALERARRFTPERMLAGYLDAYGRLQKLRTALVH
jgi:glycosyltransferase involved in cell wall biosynthesis